MPDAVYFESNNVAQFDISASTVVGTTTANTFDSSVVDSSIQIPAAVDGDGTTYYAGMPIVVGGPSLTTLVYGHFETYNTGTASPALGLANTFFLRIRNSSGQVIFRVRPTTGSSTAAMQCEYWNGSTFTAVGGTFGINFIGRQTWDFSFLPGASGTFQLKLNGSTSPVISVSGFNAAVNNTAVVDIGNCVTATGYISQCVLANFDLRGSKLAVPRINGNGFYTDGTGTYTDINTVVQNQTTGIGLTVVGNRKTFTKPSVVTTGMVIHNVSMNILTAVSGGTVTNVRSIVRRASSDYSNANYSTPARGLEQRQLPVYTDPSTGVAWTLVNFNASELGVQAQ